MAALFGGAKQAKQKATPELDTGEVQAAAQRQRAKARRARGARQTLISRNLPAGSQLKQTFGA